VPTTETVALEHVAAAGGAGGGEGGGEGGGVPAT
jgi:hypothetical protein